MTDATNPLGALEVPVGGLAALPAPLAAARRANFDGLRKAGEVMAEEVRAMTRESRPSRLTAVNVETVTLARGDMRAALRLARLVGREIGAGHEYTAALVAAAVRGDADVLDEFRDMAEGDGRTADLARAVLSLVDVLTRLAADGMTRSRVALALVAGEIERTAAAVAPTGPADLPPDPWHRDILSAVAPTNGPNAFALTCADSGHAWATAA